MTRRRIKPINQLDAMQSDFTGVFNDTPSLTIPEQSYTIRELFARYSRGLSSDVHEYEPFYDDKDLDDFEVDEPFKSDASFESVEQFNEHERNKINSFRRGVDSPDETPEAGGEDSVKEDKEVVLSEEQR